MPPFNLALSGKMCSGKTTAAKFAMSKLEKVEKISFSDPIYEIARKYFGMVEKDREILIWVGEKFRERDPKIWVKLLKQRVKDLNAQGVSVIIDDVRLPVELEALHEVGFYTVRLNISPPEQEKRIRTLYPETFQDHLAKRNHYTETALDDDSVQWNSYIAHDLRTDMIQNIISKIILRNV